VVADDLLADSAASIFSAAHADRRRDALASGPVVVSTPLVSKIFRMARRRAGGNS